MNNNLMELNTEEVQKKKEKEEKRQELKNKWKQWKEKREEEKEDRKRAKAEKERVKEQERLSKESSTNLFQDKTITNETIRKASEEKKAPSPLEEKRKKAKRKKIIRNIMTIPEIILIVLLAMFLKTKYTEYAEKAHQTLNYVAGDYLYEIHRDADKITVSKNRKLVCDQEPCNVETLDGYEIKFDSGKMKLLRAFMDIKFFFKNDTQSTSLSELKTTYGKRCIFSMIHNDSNFLQFKTYSGYKVLDYEQMSRYTQRGYVYENKEGSRMLYVAMGERTKSGYALVVNSVYKRGDDLYFYMKEQTPDNVENSFSLVTHPLIEISLEETPKDIYVINVETGEYYPNYETSNIEIPVQTTNQNGVNNAVGDLIGSLRDAIKKD